MKGSDDRCTRDGGITSLVDPTSRRYRTLAVGAFGLLSIVAVNLPLSVSPAKTQSPTLAVSSDTSKLAAQPPPHLEAAASETAAVVPISEAPVPEPPQAQPPPLPDPCGDALAWVAQAGLPLPAGVDYHCPSTQFPHQGAACWNGSPCRGSGFIAINMELLAGKGDEYLRHVVAHEVCHILDFQTTGRTTEAGADACAAAHGAPA